MVEACVVAIGKGDHEFSSLLGNLEDSHKGRLLGVKGHGRHIMTVIEARQSM